MPGPSDSAPPARAEAAPVDVPEARPRLTPAAPRRPELTVSVTELADFHACPRSYALGRIVGLEEIPRREAREVPDEEAEGVDERDPKEWGTLAHRALELLDFGQPARQQLLALLAAEGVDPSHGEAQALMRNVERFAGSELGALLAEVPKERIWREVPIVLAVEGDIALHLRGKLDLLAVLDDGDALLLDYKYAVAPTSKKLDPAHGFQLASYALAMRSFLPAQTRVRAGVVYLRDEALAAQAVAIPAQALAAHPLRLQTLAAEMLSATSWEACPVLDERECRRMRCGYRYFCHAGSGGGETGGPTESRAS